MALPQTALANTFGGLVPLVQGRGLGFNLVGKALLGVNMAKKGYLREERLEPLEWGPYVPGECVLGRVVTAMVRWHGPNHEKPARLPNGPSLNPPQDCLVS